jgi:hypothetical protein
MARRGEPALNPTDVLPPVLVRRIFTGVPADARARAACVCPAWRAAVADPALWRRLDLSAASGMTCRIKPAVLRAAAARARGGLEALDITGHDYSWKALRAVVAANGASLRELRTLGATKAKAPLEDDGFSFDQDHAVESLRELLAAAPGLQVLEADIECTFTPARRLLRNDPPFGPLRLRRLDIWYGEDGVDFPTLEELVGHPSLTELMCSGGGETEEPFEQAQLDTLVDAALALHLTAVELANTDLSPEAAPTLVRLLGSEALTQLELAHVYLGGVLTDPPAAALLLDALRANRTLRSLTLRFVELWNDIPAGVALVHALSGHASLRSLNLASNEVYSGVCAANYRNTVGAALATLVAADAPALEELDVSHCSLGGMGPWGNPWAMGPLCDALPLNSHLRKLAMFDENTHAAFLSQRLLPAVRANTSLRELGAGQHGHRRKPNAAVQHVAAREAARVAAEAAAAAGGA